MRSRTGWVCGGENNAARSHELKCERLQITVVVLAVWFEEEKEPDAATASDANVAAETR